MIEYDFPSLKVKMEVAAGFYVRSFARDIGSQLCGGGYCKSLRREAVGKIAVSSAIKLAEVVESELKSPEQLLELPYLKLSDVECQRFKMGQRLLIDTDEKSYLVQNSKAETFGVGKINQGVLQPKVVF